MNAEELRALKKLEKERDTLRLRLDTSLDIMAEMDKWLGDALTALGHGEKEGGA